MPSPTTPPTLPVISYAKLAGGDTEELDRLREVSHTIGFFYLADHGVDTQLRDTLITSAKQFFALPQEQKEEISNLNNRHYRGYSSLGDERTQDKVDWREQLDYSLDRPAPPAAELIERPWRVLEGPNPWPTQIPALKGAVNEYITRLTHIGRTLIYGWAQALGQHNPTFNTQFEAAFETPSPLLKLVHYPAVEGSESDQGVGAHKDTGVVTLLYIEPGSSGLQVETGHGWIDVEPVPDTYVVNIGEQLERATQGYLVATRHRVQPTQAGSERYSFPFFLIPNLDAVLPTFELSAEYAAAARGVGRDCHGEHIYEVTGRNSLKSRLRAHPETTAKFNQAIADSLAAV